jgi:hypothetical protein
VSVATEVIVDLLARGHEVRFRATGDSMHPIIRGEDYLHVIPAQTVRRGDVVLMLASRGLTAHRVVEVTENTLVTRGDNIAENDAPIDRTRVLGIVTHAERNGRKRRVRSIALSLYLAIRHALLDTSPHAHL